MPKHILILAGDPSADEHGAALVQALRSQQKDIFISALGGKHLQHAADQFLFPLVGVGGFGFLEPLFKIPTLWKVLHTLKTFLHDSKPDVVVPMDYYGFNIHVARAAKAVGIPVVYYISPQIWASRPHRVQELRKVVTKVLVILPFEKAIYEKAGVPVAFVGHPLLDKIDASIGTVFPDHDNALLGKLAIGLLPGSRRGVAERHIPIMVQTAQEIRQQIPEASFILFRPSELSERFYQPFLKDTPWIELTRDEQYVRRKTLSLAISVSGTASLENALLGIPMVLMYKLSSFTYAVAKRLIRVPYIGMPNLLANRLIVPELIQDKASPSHLRDASLALLKDPVALQKTNRELLQLREKLGGPGASVRAAQEILKA